MVWPETFMNKAFALIDCNCFYVSCERIFRADIRTRPTIVLSNNDGCAIARSPEAKSLGIKMGEPYFKIKKLHEQKKLQVFSANFALYTNISKRFSNIISSLAPRVEVYSIDETFADLTGLNNLTDLGLRIHAKILDELKIPTCVGIAPTKVLAKLANKLAKKSSKSNVINLIDSKHLELALKMTAIEDVWGIGRASSEKLKLLGIETALDFKNFDNDLIIQRLLSKVGLAIKKELQGISCFDLEYAADRKKSIMCSRTFAQDIYEKSALKEIVANFTSDVACELRRQKSLCKEISIYARANRFNDKLIQHKSFEKITLINPTSNTFTLISKALELVDKMYQDGLSYKKIGVQITNFFDNDNYQVDFFYPYDTNRDEKVMKTLDQINLFEGKDKLKSLACGLNRKSWSMNRNFKSPAYLTSWDELFNFG